MNKAEDSLRLVASEVIACRRCRLCESRRTAVPGDGAANAKVVFIGEAPGEQEDLQGLPFVGAAGRILSELLQSIGLTRGEVYITNVVKCRPPNNRPPRKDEVESCGSYLQRQMALIQPKVICLLGNSALNAVLNAKEPITTLHGRPMKINNRIYFPMYHPAAALYTFAVRRIMEEDFKNLRKLLDTIP